MKRFAPILILLAATILVAAKEPSKEADPNGLIVHEWGTFTSIAGPTGEAIEWMPLEGPSDLPCFVDRFNNVNIKGRLTAPVRMETPVLYFYSQRPMTLDVSVHFRQGLISEWFPHAEVTPASGNSFFTSADFTGGAFWRDIKLAPGSAPEFPTENAPSHYYAARKTDSTPLMSSSQAEKFLFYRGIGRFKLPIVATVESDRVRVKNRGSDEIASIILFENRDGKLGYQLHRGVRDELTLEPGPLNSNFASLASDLESILIENGLYQKEAEAMIETWRDSWFEQGSRLFYIYPQREIDRILPLEIHPAPSKTSRVFVGRIELVTDATQSEIQKALSQNDTSTLRKYGRFLQPISSQLLASGIFSKEEKRRASEVLDSVYSSSPGGASVCR